jgi:hypothetical protein
MKPFGAERIRNEKAEQIPALPERRADSATEAAGWAVAAIRRRGRHGQLCPVWVRSATVDECNCWILPDAVRDVTRALAAAQLWVLGGGS